MSTAVATRAHEVDTWELFDENEAPAEDARRSPLELLELKHATDDAAAIQAQFDALADELVVAAAGASSTRRVARHPAYGDILALGPDAVPLLLGRVTTGQNRPIWLRLLGSLTTFQPGAGKETIPEAAEAWLRWARREGRLVGRA
jgi:hypothetical protein